MLISRWKFIDYIFIIMFKSNERYQNNYSIIIIYYLSDFNTFFFIVKYPDNDIQIRPINLKKKKKGNFNEMSNLQFKSHKRQ